MIPASAKKTKIPSNTEIAQYPPAGVGSRQSRGSVAAPKGTNVIRRTARKNKRIKKGDNIIVHCLQV